MSYQRAKQLVSGNIPPWQKLLNSAGSMGAANLFPKSSEEIRDIPNVAGSVLADYTTLPFTDIGPRKFMDVPEPETEYGKSMRTAANIAPLLVGGIHGTRGIGNLINKMEISKVSKIQNAFGPWVKGYTKEYGKAFRGGIKDVIKNPKNQGGNLIKEVQRIFNPLKRSETFQNLPSKTQKAIEKVYNPSVNTRDVLNASNRLRKSPQAKKFDEDGSLIRDTTEKLKGIVKRESPEFSKVDREYGEFSGVRDVMEKFNPSAKGQGQYSTQSGTRILRNIKKREPGDIKAMERFGKETGIDIVGPAKTAANVRGVGKSFGKVMPWASAGGIGYLMAKKLLNDQVSNNNYYPQT